MITTSLAAKNKPRVLSGDMQYGSVGTTSTHGQYTVSDAETGDVLVSELVDKRETGGSSMRMELYGCLRCLYILVSLGLSIKKLITDSHVLINKFFRKLLFILRYVELYRASAALCHRASVSSTELRVRRDSVELCIELCRVTE
jgi:hypothetical protein